MAGFEPPRWLTASHLVAPVRRLHRSEDVGVSAWTCDPITRGAGEALGVWRVAGSATTDGTTSPFTLILKAWPGTNVEVEPTSWNLPERELLAYTSGILDDLPGAIDAPRCLGTCTEGDGASWAWLTPMSDGALERWDLGHFALVARRLGQFNGEYLAGKPLPEAEWLSRQWCRSWTEAARASIERFDVYIEHPRVASAFPLSQRRSIERLFAERHRWFDAIDALPQTFCHLDAFPRNIFLRPRPDGELALGVIDWSFTGIAAVGEELAPLVSSSVLFGEAEGLEIADLDETVFGAYIEGLRDAGWHGDQRSVRRAYTGSLAMRYLIGPLRNALPVLASPHAETTIRQVFGASPEELNERIARHDEWAWGIADEFRRLLATCPPRLPNPA